MKFCNGPCKLLKGFGCFGFRSDTKDKLQYICIECKKEVAKKYRVENKNSIAKYKAEYYKENKEKIAKYAAKYHKENKETISKRAAKHRQKNRVELCCRQRDYRSKNKEKVKASRAEYYKRNKKEITKKKAEYYSNNKERWSTYVAQRQRLQHHVKAVNTLESLQMVLDIYKQRPEGFHVDHIIPLNHKDICGLHVPWNPQYLTAEENLKKSNKFDLNNPKKYDFTNNEVNSIIRERIKHG